MTTRRTAVRPWRTMECSLLTAWKTNRNLLVESRVKAFPGRQTNSGSTQPRAVHLEGGEIGCHQCVTSHSGSAPASLDMRQTSSGFVPHACQPQLHPRLYPTTIDMTNYTQAPTVTNSSVYQPQL